MKFLLVIVSLFISLASFAVDYDCVFIGSSPIAMFEAMYQHELGKKVLIIDEAPTLGGAWKSIEMCGVPHVDLGCHEIGANAALKQFLEVYGGCRMVPSGSNFYFSQGCHELTSNMQERLTKMGIDILLGIRAESAFLDEMEAAMVIRLPGTCLSTSKIYMSSYTFIPIDNEPMKPCQKAKYHHLYLLISDEGRPRFTYLGHGVNKVSRMMNLTSFVNLEHTGQQLIVFQTYAVPNEADGPFFLDELKKKNLVAPEAYILKAEKYTYEQWPAGLCRPQGKYQPYFEMLQTHRFQNMALSIAKWQQVLQPYMK